MNNYRIALTLAFIVALRIIGLLIILPVFTPYAQHLPGATPTLIGLALGIYGLTQAVLQIPFGWSSDYLGRKPVIRFGLLVFAIGSMVAATAHTIWGIILGRALQGGGAISSTVMAYLTDCVSEEKRSRSIAILGMTVGVSFSVAILLGPFLSQWFSVQHLFWITAGMALFALTLVSLPVLPNPAKASHAAPESTGSLKSVLRNRYVICSSFSIFCLHILLITNFYTVPLLLKETFALTHLQQTSFYAGIIITSFIMTWVWLRYEHSIKEFWRFMIPISLVMISQALLSFFSLSFSVLCVSYFIFFTGFNILEASLPGAIAKHITSKRKGLALGLYSTIQFLGIFGGGALAGFWYTHYASSGVFQFSAMLACVWWCVIALIFYKTKIRALSTIA